MILLVQEISEMLMSTSCININVNIIELRSSLYKTERAILAQNPACDGPSLVASIFSYIHTVKKSIAL